MFGMKYWRLAGSSMDNDVVIRILADGFTNERIDLSNPKPRQITGGSGRGDAWWGGGAGRALAGRDADGSVRRGDFSRASNTPVLNDSSEARTKEILCKPIGEQNQRFNFGTASIFFVPGCWPLGRRLFVCVRKTFSCKSCLGTQRFTYRIQSPDIPRAGRRKAGRQGGAGPGWALGRRVVPPTKVTSFVVFQHTCRTKDPDNHGRVGVGWCTAMRRGGKAGQD